MPIDSIVAQINIDMIGRGRAGDIPGGGPDYLGVVGSFFDSKDLGETVQAVNKKQAKPFALDYRYDSTLTWSGYNNIYGRSDHFNYALQGVPIAFFFTGLHGDYHQRTRRAGVHRLSALRVDRELHPRARRRSRQRSAAAHERVEAGEAAEAVGALRQGRTGDGRRGTGGWRRAVRWASVDGHGGSGEDGGNNGWPRGVRNAVTCLCRPSFAVLRRPSPDRPNARRRRPSRRPCRRPSPVARPSPPPSPSP